MSSLSISPFHSLLPPTKQNDFALSLRSSSLHISLQPNTRVNSYTTLSLRPFRETKWVNQFIHVRFLWELLSECKNKINMANMKLLIIGKLVYCFFFFFVSSFMLGEFFTSKCEKPHRPFKEELIRIIEFRKRRTQTTTSTYSSEISRLLV